MGKHMVGGIVVYKFSSLQFVLGKVFPNPPKCVFIHQNLVFVAKTMAQENRLEALESLYLGTEVTVVLLRVSQQWHKWVVYGKQRCTIFSNKQPNNGTQWITINVEGRKDYKHWYGLWQNR